MTSLKTVIISDMILKAQDTGNMENLYKSFDIPYEKSDDESLNFLFESWLLLKMNETFEKDTKEFDRRIQLSGI